MTIWKFDLPVGDQAALQMPIGAKVLAVQVQRGTPCIWAEVDPDAGWEQRLFVIRGTGHPFRGGERQYVGTFQLEGGALVFHVYEQ